MKAIVLMFDSLNRHCLSPYGCEWTKTPNFQRLAERSLTFDASYVCSMPCMPARREMHTARPNFLHNGWCPLEPFDESVPQMLQQAGVCTHIATDHYHYLENNGVNYLTKYSSWEAFRGQEGDPVVGQVADPDIPENINGKGLRQDWVNRPFFQSDDDHYQTKTVAAGLDFIQRNRDADNWMLQIECFDPHEPFFCDPKYKERFPDDYDGPLFDWPGYRPARETPEQVEHLRRNYAALLSKCDDSLGEVLDAFDAFGLWEDTLLVVMTDHGFLLGEHGWWAKNAPPLYEEISHTPFFVWDPRTKAAGQRRQALVQPALDIGPTLLRFFGLEPTDLMLGRDLAPVIAEDEPVREAALFGYFGKGLNVADGRHVLYREVPDEKNQPLHAYSLTSPAAPSGGKAQSKPALEEATLTTLPFSKGSLVLKTPAASKGFALGKPGEQWLFDIRDDPRQKSTIDDPEVARRLLAQAAALMRACDAPPEQFERLGL